MSCCILCGVESLDVEDEKDALHAKESSDVFDLIHLYLPFYELPQNPTSISACLECTKELNQFHNFYTKIEEIYLHSKSKIPQDDTQIDDILTEESQVEESFLQIEKLPRPYRRRTADTFNSFCDICKEPLTSFKDAIVHHKRVHNQPGYVTCCDRKFKQQSLFFDHLDLHQNPQKFSCKICDKKFSSNGNLKTHENLHKTRESLICDLCGRKFRNKYKITAHIKEYHSKSLKKFSCSKCDKKFSSKARFESHQKSHEILKIFCCEICGRELKTSTSLREHLKNFHADDSKRIECHLCGHFLKNSYSMRKHLNRHRQMEQNIKCEICQKPCTTKAALSSHMRMKHVLQRTIPCRHCDKKFKQKIDRDEHESTHTGIDLYKCDFCPMSFKFGANFRAHRKAAHPVEYEKVKARWLRPN